MPVRGLGQSGFGIYIKLQAPMLRKVWSLWRMEDLRLLKANGTTRRLGSPLRGISRHIAGVAIPALNVLLCLQ